MQTQTKFCKQNFVFSLVKIILNFFSGEPKVPLIPKVGPLPNTKKLLLRLSAGDGELLSTPNMITFVAISLSKLHQHIVTIFKWKYKQSINVPKCWINQIIYIIVLVCVVISDLHLFHKIKLSNPCFIFSKKLMLPFIKKVTTGT